MPGDERVYDINSSHVVVFVLLPLYLNDIEKLETSH
jgi:hypothetical protein